MAIKKTIKKKKSKADAFRLGELHRGWLARLARRVGLSKTYIVRRLIEDEFSFPRLFEGDKNDD